MARSSAKKSLAGQAVSAARRIVRPRSSAVPDGEPVEKQTAAKKTPAKKTPAKKTAAKKAAAKKTPAKKTAAKKTPATKAPAEKTRATKAAATKTPAKKAAPKATGKKATAAEVGATSKTAAAKKAAPKNAPAKKSPASSKTPATKSPAKKAVPVKKTAAAAQAAPSQLVVLEGEEAWSKAELAEVVAELHEQRTHSEELLGAQEEELSALLRDAGDGAGLDQADVGATTFERDHELTVVNHEREKVAQIDRALARIDDGTYGVCESCGNPIGKMRLMAFPRATLCMACKQREERRGY